MIYILNSSQSAMLTVHLNKMIKESLPEHDDLNFVKIDMSTSKILDLSNECLSLPIGYEKKAVIAENFHYLASSKTKKKLLNGDDDAPLLDFFKNPDPCIELYILVYSDKLDERSAYYKALKESGSKFFSIKPFDESDWQKYIPTFLSKKGCIITPDAITELSDRINGDYALFLQEGNKLATYANGETITVDTVKQLVSAPLEDDVFALSNALTRGDKLQALHVFKDMQTKGSSGGAIPLMNMLSNQFIFLDQVRFLYKRGYDPIDIAAKLNCSPGRVKASSYSIRKMSANCLHRAINQLYRYQSYVFQGKMNDILAFELFLANFEL